MLDILTVLDVILAAISSVFIVKYLLINFTSSKKTIKNVLRLVCIIIPLYITIAGAYTALTLKESKALLQQDLKTAGDKFVNGVSEKDQINEELKVIDKKTNEMVIYSIVGYLSFCAAYAINKNIKKEIAETKTKGSWNIDKFNK